MNIITSSKIVTNRALRLLGVELVKTDTLKRILAEQSQMVAMRQTEVPPPEVPPPIEAKQSFDHERLRELEDFKHSFDANVFRMEASEGRPTENVDRAFLHNLFRESAALRRQGDELIRLRRTVELLSAGTAPVEHSPALAHSSAGQFYTPIYDFDGLRNDPYIIHNHDFMRDPRFVAAYGRALEATIIDHRYYWRVHIALWCASIALTLEGDFVECGVWKGLLSTAVASYFNWDTLNRKFFLFDTFRGVDEKQLSDEEINNIPHFRIGYGEDIYDHVVKNFSEFKNITIVRGSVPEALPTVNIDKVSYLSIDMNNAAPEIAAANYFWDRLSPGAPILLDDYGFVRYEAQKKAFDAFAAERGVQILALPTGQALMIKPR